MTLWSRSKRQSMQPEKFACNVHCKPMDANTNWPEEIEKSIANFVKCTYICYWRTWANNIQCLQCMSLISKSRFRSNALLLFGQIAILMRSNTLTATPKYPIYDSVHLSPSISPINSISKCDSHFDVIHRFMGARIAFSTWKIPSWNYIIFQYFEIICN